MRIILKTIIAAFFCLMAGQANAQADLADAAKGLLSKSYSDKIQATEAIAASGNERATPFLEALYDGNLFATKADERLVILAKKGGADVAVDAVTGEELGAVQSNDLSKIRINNRMRGLIKDLLGRLTLLNEDPALRINAANAIFKSRPAEMVAPLTEALAMETDEKVAAVMRRALAMFRPTLSLSLANNPIRKSDPCSAPS